VHTESLDWRRRADTDLSIHRDKEIFGEEVLRGKRQPHVVGGAIRDHRIEVVVVIVGIHVQDLRAALEDRVLVRTAGHVKERRR
jgi:hypothetical protein